MQTDVQVQSQEEQWSIYIDGVPKYTGRVEQGHTYIDQAPLSEHELQTVHGLVILHFGGGF